MSAKIEIAGGEGCWYYNHGQCNLRSELGHECHKDTCPGPGTYHLVREETATVGALGDAIYRAINGEYTIASVARAVRKHLGMDGDE